MESSIWKRAAKFLREHKSHRNWAIVVVCLALVVTVGTITVLKYTGSAMTRADRVLDCPLSVHEHTYDCYDDYGDVVCGLADYVVHTHDDSCYDKDGALACTLPEIEEHRHSASCYTTESVLSCGYSESAGHVHSDSCYATEESYLSCGYDAHAHSDDCYTYDEETGESYLSCGYDEHTHSDDCYTGGGSYLACGREEGEGAHWHDDSCYETREVRTCGKLENHTHDDYDCYDEYGNLTCTLTALEKHVHTDACFVTVTEEDADEAEAVENETDAADEAGASDEPAEEASDELDAEKPDEGIITQTVTTEHYTVSVSYGAEANIPAEAELRVVEYSADSEEYQNRIREAEISGIGYSKALLNVGFWVGDTEIEPAAPVSVTVTVTGMAADGDAIVTHFLDDGNAEIIDTTSTEAEDGQSAISFELPSFSDILVMFGNGFEVPTNDTQFTGTWAIVNDNSGFAMTGEATTSNNGQNALVATQDYTIVTEGGVKKVYGGSVAAWTFEAAGDGKYYISTTTADGLCYLSIEGYYNLKLVKDKVALTVAANDAGKILISNQYGNYDCNINRYSGEEVFAAYHDDEDNSQQSLYPIYTTESTEGTLIYDLGLSSDTKFFAPTYNFSWTNEKYWLEYDGENKQWISNRTKSALSMKDSIQTVAKNGSTLFTTDNFSYAPVYNGNYIFASISWLKLTGLPDDCPPGMELKFLGWKAADINGEEVNIPAAGATAKRTDAGIEIKWTDDETNSAQTVTVPSGTILRGRWEEASNLVMFFVNYGGTILDVQQTAAKGSEIWTPAIAIGRVLNPEYALNPNGDSTDTREVSDAIEALIDGENTNTDMKLDIRYIAISDDSSDSVDLQAALGLNSNIANFTIKAVNYAGLEKALFDYVKILAESRDFTLYGDSAYGSDSITLNKDNATVGNYGVRWYTFKEQTENWHIDGVLEAKTTEFPVYKTFVGLDAEQQKTVLENGFSISVGIDNAANSLQLYMDMKANESDSYGRYKYLGETGQVGKDTTYGWSVYAISGENYGFQENNYELDGYDVTPELVYRVRNADGSIDTDSAMGITEIKNIKHYAASSIESAYFFNYYTETGTGALVVEKKDEKGNLLSGAKFALKNGDTIAYEATTDSNGVAEFSGLEPGTYTLEETEAPAGYTHTDETWTVVVQSDGEKTETLTCEKEEHEHTNACYWYGLILTCGKTEHEHSVDNGCYTISETKGTTTVTVGDVTYYESGEVINRLPVTNVLTATTLRVRKVFQGIDTTQLTAMVNGSYADAANPYYISIDGRDDVLYLQDATRNGYTFEWSVTGVEEGEYILTEHNYLNANYKDTAVTASYRDKALEVTKSAEAKTAFTSFTFTENDNNTLTLTNRYTNKFSLRLTKVDEKTGDALTGAAFDVYTSRRGDADDLDKFVPYNGKTYYYKGTLTDSGNGVYTIDGLELERSEYIIVETKAPDGYVKASEPKVLGVVTGTSENYSADCVYETDFKNAQSVDLTIQKRWAVDAPENAKLVMYLYQSKDGTNITQYSDYVTLTKDNSDGDWSSTWSVPKYYKDDNGNYQPYIYYVTEEAVYVGEELVDDYSVMYGDSRTNLTWTLADGTTKTIVAGRAKADSDGNLLVTIVNSSSYELPHTGGMGTALYLLCGCAIMLLGLAGFAGRMRRRRAHG